MARMRKGRRKRKEPFLKGGKKDLVKGEEADSNVF